MTQPTPSNVPTEAITPSFSSWLLDTLERVLVTAGYAIAALFAGDQFSDFDSTFLQKLATVGIVAVFVAVKQAVLPPTLKNPMLDVVSRMVWTGIQAAGAIIIAGAGFDAFSATAWQTAGIAFVAAVISFIKGLLATRMSRQTVTPASLVAAV